MPTVTKLDLRGASNLDIIVPRVCKVIWVDCVRRDALSVRDHRKESAWVDRHRLNRVDQLLDYLELQRAWMGIVLPDHKCSVVCCGRQDLLL